MPTFLCCDVNPKYICISCGMKVCQDHGMEPLFFKRIAALGYIEDSDDADLLSERWIAAIKSVKGREREFACKLFHTWDRYNDFVAPGEVTEVLR